MIALTHPSLVQDYWRTTTDLAHIGAELTMEVVTGLVGLAIGLLVRPIRRHDAKHHRRAPSASVEQAAVNVLTKAGWELRPSRGPQ